MKAHKTLILFSSTFLIFSSFICSYILKEKKSLDKAIADLETYRVKLMRQKRTLETLAFFKEEMNKQGMYGQQGSIDINATFVVTDFKQFVNYVHDLYYKGGYFFLDKFTQRTNIPNKEDVKNGTLKEPVATVNITGKKIVGYKR